MELHQFRYALAVGRFQSFTRAADAIPVSVASVSEAIRTLESELGVALFERTTRRVRPTRAGELFLECAARVLAEAEAARLAVEPYRRLGTDSVSLGTPTAVVESLPALLAGFRRNFPGIELRLIEAPTGRLLQALRSREVDVSFLTWPDGRIPQDIESHEMDRADTGIALFSSHPLVTRDLVDLPAIGVSPMVLYGAGYGLREVALEVCHRAGFVPHVVFEVTEPETLRNLVRAGVAITIMGRVHAEVAGLAFVRCAPAPLDVVLSVAWLRSRPLSPPAELLRDQIYEARDRIAMRTATSPRAYPPVAHSGLPVT